MTLFLADTTGRLEGLQFLPHHRGGRLEGLQFLPKNADTTGRLEGLQFLPKNTRAFEFSGADSILDRSSETTNTIAGALLPFVVTTPQWGK
jgi:hypothetical protein